jgi:hypothetical protein
VADRDGTDRSDYIRATVPVLWPGRVARTGAGTSSDAGRASRYLVVPSQRRPRVVVPADRRMAAAALRAYGSRLSARARFETRLMSTALAVGAAGLFAGRMTIEPAVDSREPRGGVDGEASRDIVEHLSAVIGEPVGVALHVTAARANRKPVLQVIDARGRIRAFVKVGTDELTARLLAVEADALRHVADARPRTFQAPHVLHHGSWHGLPVLVLAPLPTWVRGRRAPYEAVAAAAREIGSLGDGTERALADTASRERALADTASRERALADTAFWARTKAAVAELAPSPRASTLAELATGVEALHGDIPLRLGAWHGDWAPWNMCAAAGRLLVWDWERFERAVPLGFDSLHYRLQDRIVCDGRRPADVARACVAEATELVGSPNASPDRAAAVAATYLLTLGVRYEADGQERAGSPLGRLETWLLPALEETLAPVRVVRTDRSMS